MGNNQRMTTLDDAIKSLEGIAEYLLGESFSWLPGAVARAMCLDVLTNVMRVHGMLLLLQAEIEEDEAQDE